MSDRNVTLEERLHAHPRLKNSVESLLAIVEERSFERATADEAEWRVIEALRRLGNALLHEWAETQEAGHVEAVREHHATMVGHGKKNSIGTPALEKSPWLNGCFCMRGIWCDHFQKRLL